MKICMKRFRRDMCDHIIFESQNLFIAKMAYMVVSSAKEEFASGARCDTFDGPYSMLCMYVSSN